MQEALKIAIILIVTNAVPIFADANKIDDKPKSDINASHQDFIAHNLQTVPLATHFMIDDHDRPIYGNPDAPTTIIEYGDTECSFCKKQHAVLKKFVSDSNGQVKWVWKHKPSNNNSSFSFRQSVIASCVFLELGNAHFWAYLDDIYQTTQMNGKGADYIGLAFAYGLDKEALATCIQEAKELVVEDKRGLEPSVNITPAMSIISHSGRKKLLLGYHDYSELIYVYNSMQR